MWVVSSHSSILSWKVRFLIGSEACGRPETSQYCPHVAERPGAERPGQDGVRLATALCRLSTAIDTLPSLGPVPHGEHPAMYSACFQVHQRMTPLYDQVKDKQLNPIGAHSSAGTRAPEGPGGPDF
ncbi:unnamed protein product [Pleuronectes platessa]|uniref:Uncharacterized protein n=1 Tax=Pleuronectes platessa TaxID=8262 RepID=A0A9N7V031_PLEPL|nr:unnamed protein product [Pleuronectes platessa]